MLLATFSCIHTRVALFYHWEKYCRVLEKWKHPWKFSLEKMSALKRAFASMKWPIDWLLILKPKKKIYWQIPILASQSAYKCLKRVATSMLIFCFFLIQCTLYRKIRDLPILKFIPQRNTSKFAIFYENM